MAQKRHSRIPNEPSPYSMQLSHKNLLFWRLTYFAASTAGGINDAIPSNRADPRANGDVSQVYDLHHWRSRPTWRTKMQLKLFAMAFVSSLVVVAYPAMAAGPSVGAAPKGDATKVASRIIKDSFPKCKRVSNASRSPDGSIRAKCDGIDYMVFTLFDPKEAKVLELAMNCTVAKRLLSVSC